MKYILKYTLYTIIMFGYILNMYFLTVDPNTRDYQWINKVGIVLVPIGSIMGYVYIIDVKGFVKDPK